MTDKRPAVGAELIDMWRHCNKVGQQKRKRFRHGTEGPSRQIYLFLQGGMPHHPTTTLWVTVALLCDSRVMHALTELSMLGDSESVDRDKLYSHNVNFTSIIMRHADWRRLNDMKAWVFKCQTGSIQPLLFIGSANHLMGR